MSPNQPSYDEDIARKLNNLDYRLNILESIEYTQNRNPQVAKAIARWFMFGWSGIRAIWTYNNNLYDNNRFNLSLPGFPQVNWDNSRLYSYMTCNQTTPSYLRDENPGHNFWTVDAGVANWNPNEGLTAGAWIRRSSGETDDEGVISAWNANLGIASWRLFVEDSAGALSGVSKALVFGVSSSGGYQSGNNALGTVTVPTDKWCLAVGRWTPSTEIKMFLFYDGQLQDEQVDTSSVPSSLYRGSRIDGYVGAHKRNAGTYAAFEGDIFQPWFCVNAHTDETIKQYYRISRHILGV